VEEIVSVMRAAGEDPHGRRLQAMIAVLWRAGLRVQEALTLTEHDLEPRRGSVLVRHGKGGRRREIGMDDWGTEQLRPWLDERFKLPAGALFCVIDGPTRGHPWSTAGVRREFRRVVESSTIRSPDRAGVEDAYATLRAPHLAVDGAPAVAGDLGDLLVPEAVGEQQQDAALALRELRDERDALTLLDERGELGRVGDLLLDGVIVSQAEWGFARGVGDLADGLVARDGVQPADRVVALDVDVVATDQLGPGERAGVLDRLA